MILHVSRTRFDQIQSQGYRFPVRHPTVLTQPVLAGDNEIHLLDGEHARCATCGCEYDSIIASTPAEWEEAKERLSKTKKEESGLPKESQ